MKLFQKYLSGSSLKVTSTTNFVMYLATVALSLSTYRVMISATSIEVVGCWALIQGLAAVSRIADFGLGTNITRFVAGLRPPSRATIGSTVRLAATLSFLPVSLLACGLSPLIYFFTIHRAGLTITHREVALLVGMSLGAALLATVSALASSVLEGFGKVVVASVTTTLYNAITLLLILPSIWAFGPIGIGAANLIGLASQTGIVLVFLSQHYALLPERSDKDYSMRELFVRLRASTMQNFGVVLARMALDPLTRVLVARSAPLDVMAYFELALRVCSQTRAALQAAVQPLLYIGASDTTRAAERFREPQRVLTSIAGLCMVGLNTAGPILSYAVLGNISPEFLLILLVLSLGPVASIIGLPGYYVDAASGRFGRLLKTTLQMVAVNVVVGGTLSLAIGPIGGTIGYSIAFASGGYFLLQSWSTAAGERTGGIVRSAVISMLLSAMVSFLFQAISSYLTNSLAISLVLSAALSGLLIAPVHRLAKSIITRPAARRST